MSAARLLGQIVYRVVPKSKTAVFNGQPDYCDDVLALEKVLRDTHLCRLVILCSSRKEAKARSKYPELDPRTLTVAKRSLRGLYYLMTAKYPFFTHSFAMQKFPASVESVNVWHGMPVKRVGWMTESGPLLPAAKYSLATSPFWEVVVQESLRPTARTLVTGLPRNDRLLLGDRGVLKALGYPPESGTKLIAWLPTYRYDRTDGDLRVHSRHVLGLRADQLAGLNQLLERENALMVVKRHPMAAAQKTPELSRIRYLSDEWLQERGFTLHELLGESVALVTDVSSAYVDYLVVDRPIVHHFPDVEEYGRSRGYSFEPIRDYLAGPVVDDPAGLTAALADILKGKDTHAKQRRGVRDLFHDPLGGSAAERVARELGLAPRRDARAGAGS